MSSAITGDAPCTCHRHDHEPKFVVVTGGPGAGKTALLELARRDFCEHVVVLPEAASIVFGGGFPRLPDVGWTKAAQRAIYFVQRELERGVVSAMKPALVLCDRGTLDGAAYWPGGADEWADEVGTTLADERNRYQAVIELRTPPASSYNHRNPLRLEDAHAAARSDARIDDLWSRHPRRHVLPATVEFLDKIHVGLAAIERELPACCSCRPTRSASIER